MGAFRQLGDPVCPACLCEHHGAAYAEWDTLENPVAANIVYDTFLDGVALISVPITITERCCAVVNAATIGPTSLTPGMLEIERPMGTTQTDQEDVVVINLIHLLHHAAWEVLDPGTYTYHLVNRSGNFVTVSGAWIKAIASDCEG